MANENTKRRQLYLPEALENWYIGESDLSCIKINTIMINALTEYSTNKSKKNNKKKSDFEKDVRKITLALLKEKGLV